MQKFSIKYLQSESNTSKRSNTMIKLVLSHKDRNKHRQINKFNIANEQIGQKNHMSILVVAEKSLTTFDILF
jgi:hypothetical protein